MLLKALNTCKKWKTKWWICRSPPLQKKTAFRSHVFLCCNHKWVSDYNVFPMWHLVFTVPIWQAFQKGEAYFTGGLLSCWNEISFFPHWDSPPTEIITIFLGHWCIFFFSLHRKRQSLPPWKREQSGNLSPGVTVAFIYLGSTAGYDESGYGCYSMASQILSAEVLSSCSR